MWRFAQQDSLQVVAEVYPYRSLTVAIIWFTSASVCRTTDDEGYSTICTADDAGTTRGVADRSARTNADLKTENKHLGALLPVAPRAVWLFGCFGPISTLFGSLIKRSRVQQIRLMILAIYLLYAYVR